MDKIIEYINRQTNNKYQNLLFFGAVFSKSKSAMQIQFSIDDKSLKTKQNVEELEVLCKEYLKDYLNNVSVIFKSNSLTMQEFKDIVFKVVKEQLNFSEADCKKIEFDFENADCVAIKIPERKFDLEDMTFEEIVAFVEEKISQSTLQRVKIDFLEEINKKSAVLENRKSKMIEDNIIFEQMSKAQIVDLLDVQVLYGKFTQSSANLVGSFYDNLIDGEVAVVGNVKSCQIRELKPKESSESIEDNSKKFSRKMMILELEYDNEVVRTTWFLTKETENIKEFPLDTTLAICGKLNEYRGETSINISGIARCKFNPPPKVWRSCPTNYRYVFPEPYEFTQQTGFFFEEKKTDKKYLLENSFVVYDLETTGINPEVCKIIDIGAFKIVDGKIVEKFSTFVNPKCEIPEEASKVNRITNQMVENSPTIEMALPDFYKFCYGSTIVGYNNIGFDDLFIAKESKKQFYNFDNPKDDVFRIARQNVPSLSNYKLSSVCKALDVPLIDAHRATNDALATAKLFIKLVEKYYK